VVIQPIRHPALETLPLLEEELLLAVPRHHPLADGHRRVRLAQLRDEPFVMLREGTYDLRDQTLSACRKAGFEPQVALDGSEMDSMLRFVAAGMGLAILPEMVLAGIDGPDNAVAVRRLLPRLSRSLVLARRRDRYFSAAAREFAGVLSETAVVHDVHAE
jgi:DNA-binding transcriptional LysR family regulator